MGSQIPELKLADFRRFDNGARTAIQYLWRESDLLLTVGIIVDVSFSEHSTIPRERKAVEAFLHSIMRSGDRAFLVREPCPTKSTSKGEISRCGGSAIWIR